MAYKERGLGEIDWGPDAVIIRPSSVETSYVPSSRETDFTQGEDDSPSIFDPTDFSTLSEDNPVQNPWRPVYSDEDLRAYPRFSGPSLYDSMNEPMWARFQSPIEEQGEQEDYTKFQSPVSGQFESASSPEEKLAAIQTSRTQSPTQSSPDSDSFFGSFFSKVSAPFQNPFQTQSSKPSVVPVKQRSMTDSFLSYAPKILAGTAAVVCTGLLVSGFVQGRRS